MDPIGGSLLGIPSENLHFLALCGICLVRSISLQRLVEKNSPSKEKVLSSNPSYWEKLALRTALCRLFRLSYSAVWKDSYLCFREKGFLGLGLFRQNKQYKRRGNLSLKS